MRRLAALAAFAALLLPAPTAASFHGPDFDRFNWSSYNGGRWVDVKCDTAEQAFNVVLFLHVDYGGFPNGGGVARLCAQIDDLCRVPTYPPQQYLVPGYMSCTGGTIHDTSFRLELSSIKVKAIYSTPYCIRIHELWSYQGDWLTLFVADYPNIGWYGWNDRGYSLRKCP